MRCLPVACAVSVLLLSVEARGQSCPQFRPTDPSGGLAHYDDLPHVASYDAPMGQVRVWYATTGTHAPIVTPTGPSGAPVNIEFVGEVMEDALVRFTQLGYDPPLRDGDYDACASNGGDDRLDVYLVDFASGADGAAPVEQCQGSAVQTCSGFVLLDHRYAGYPDFRTGVETVGPHELFHLIQDAYDANLDRWWAEGTAQWATKQLYPELDDLERFLPTFFNEPGRPLDSPPGGVTSGWLYATAIWPVFLGETRGADTIRSIMETMASQPLSALEAADQVFALNGDDLPSTYLSFAAFNAATGARTGPNAYSLGASYPEVALGEVTAGHGTVVDERLAGFGARYYLSLEPRELSLDADPEAVAAVAIPFVDEALDPTAALSLPAVLDGPAVVVVAGQRSSKVDAHYELISQPAPEGTGGGGAGGDGGAPMVDDNDGGSERDGGCSVRSVDSPRRPGGLLALGFIVAALTTRRRLRVSHNGEQ